METAPKLPRTEKFTWNSVIHSIQEYVERYADIDILNAADLRHLETYHLYSLYLNARLMCGRFGFWIYLCCDNTIPSFLRKGIGSTRTLTRTGIKSTRD